MARIQRLALLISAVVVVGLWYGWLHEHDTRIKREAESKHLADSLAFESKQVEAFRQALMVANLAYMKETRVYEQKQKTLKDSIRAYDARLDGLLAQIDSAVSDSNTHILVHAAGETCRNLVSAVYAQLTACDNLRQEAVQLSAKKDTVIFRLQNSRDSYRVAYENERKESLRPHNNAWSYIGKGSTLMAVFFTVGKVFQWW